MFCLKFLCVVLFQDTALSALRRNFFSDVDSELRTVEHTLTYIEAALRGYVPNARSGVIIVSNFLGCFV